MTIRTLLLSSIAIFSAVNTSCSQMKLSERDKFLQEQQQGADLKRGELMTVAGEYLGELRGSDGTLHNVRLILQVKDVTEARSGADPILVPRLLGSLRFILGNEDLGEVIDCAIRSSEYIRANNLISIVVTHAQFGELAMSGAADAASLTGTWNASSVSRSGNFNLKRVK